MRDSETELKPCPFCGSKDLAVECTDGVGLPYVTCCNCGVDGAWSPTHNEAIMKWNIRVGESQ